MKGLQDMNKKRLCDRSLDELTPEELKQLEEECSRSDDAYEQMLDRESSCISMNVKYL